MEIEVGEYVRTNDGVIAKLVRIERDDIDISLKWYVLSNEHYINKAYIVKHSKNIIDLIEAGDIVNGFNVTEIGYCSVFVDANYDDVCGEIHKTQIQTILTHQQYEANCYKLEKVEG